jgi:hypothetical protein
VSFALVSAAAVAAAVAVAVDDYQLLDALYYIHFNYYKIYLKLDFCFDIFDDFAVACCSATQRRHSQWKK